MQWEIKKGVVTDEQSEIVCLLADTASEYHLFCDVAEASCLTPETDV